MDRRVLKTAAPMFTSPEYIDDFLIGAQAVSSEPGCRGLGSFTAAAAREAPRFAGLSRKQRKELRRLLQAITDDPVSDDDVNQTLAEIGGGQYERLLTRLLKAAGDGREIPDVDPALRQEIGSIADRLVKSWYRNIQVEAADAAAAADPQTAFDLLDHLRAERAIETPSTPT